MNEFDQFMKHRLHVEHYARYTDDFAIVSENKEYLESLLPEIAAFLRVRLALELHPGKIAIVPFRRGVDFLGYVIFPKHRILRPKTKRRMLRKLAARARECESGKADASGVAQSVQSYLGVISHANAYRLREELLNRFWPFLGPE